MNRRHFLKFIPFIPVAIGLVKPFGKAQDKLPKPAENAGLAPVDEMLERIRALNEIKELYDLDQLKGQIEKAIRMRQFQQRLTEEIRKVLIEKGIGY